MSIDGESTDQLIVPDFFSADCMPNNPQVQFPFASLATGMVTIEGALPESSWRIFYSVDGVAWNSIDGALDSIGFGTVSLRDADFSDSPIVGFFIQYTPVECGTTVTFPTPGNPAFVGYTGLMRAPASEYERSLASLAVGQSIVALGLTADSPEAGDVCLIWVEPTPCDVLSWRDAAAIQPLSQVPQVNSIEATVLPDGFGQLQASCSSITISDSTWYFQENLDHSHQSAAGTSEFSAQPHATLPALLIFQRSQNGWAGTSDVEALETSTVNGQAFNISISGASSMPVSAELTWETGANLVASSWTHTGPFVFPSDFIGGNAVADVEGWISPVFGELLSSGYPKGSLALASGSRSGHANVHGAPNPFIPGPSMDSDTLVGQTRIATWSSVTLEHGGIYGAGARAGLRTFAEVGFNRTAFARGELDRQGNGYWVHTPQLKLTSLDPNFVFTTGC